MPAGCHAQINLIGCSDVAYVWRAVIDGSRENVTTATTSLVFNMFAKAGFYTLNT